MIDLQLVASARLVDLERENVDLAIRYYSDTPVPTGAIRLFGEQLVPVAHRSLGATDIETREQLAKHVLLEFDDPSHPELQWSSWLRAHRAPRAGKPTRSRILRFNQYDQVVQAALAGHGVALGRLALVAPLLRDGKLTVATRIPPVAAASAYWLLSRQPASRNAGVVHAWILRESA